VSFPTIEISEVGKVVTGSTPKAANKSAFGGEIPFVTPSDLNQDGEILSTQRHITEVGAAECKLLPKHSVLVSCIGTLGKVSIAGKKLATNQQINAIIFDEDKVFPKYGFYACRRLKPLMDLIAPSTTLPILNKTKFSNLKIPLPPLPEQKRIAEILDQTDALCQKRQQALDHLNQLGQSIFYEMFGETLENYEDATLLLRDIYDFNNGVNFSTEQKGSGVLVIDVKNMYSQDIFPNLQDVYRVSGLKNIDRRTLKKGDMLFVRSSLKREGVGWPSLFDGFSEDVLFCGFIIRGRPKQNSSEFDPRFLVHYLRQPSIRNKMISSSGTVAITNINQERLGGIKVPNVRLEAQQAFGRKMQEIELAVKSTTAELAKFKSLFASLQQRAFRGEL